MFARLSHLTTGTASPTAGITPPENKKDGGGKATGFISHLFVKELEQTEVLFSCFLKRHKLSTHGCKTTQRSPRLH